MSLPRYYKEHIHLFVCSNNVESLVVCVFGAGDPVGGKNSSASAPVGVRTYQKPSSKHLGLPGSLLSRNHTLRVGLRFPSCFLFLFFKCYVRAMFSQRPYHPLALDLPSFTAMIVILTFLVSNSAKSEREEMTVVSTAGVVSARFICILPGHQVAWRRNQNRVPVL